MKTPRRITLVGATGATYREEEYQGRTFLVVPVIAMVEGVVWPVNAPAPELVLAEELARMPQMWNGRPVVNDHPQIGDGMVSANAPEIIAESMGYIFNTSTAQQILETRRLQMEAWIDLEKSRSMSGPDDIVARILAGETVEVSVGAFVGFEETSGVWEGKKYAGIWRDIVSDHLALLSKGHIGACSVEMGCGTRHLVTAAGISIDKEKQVKQNPVKALVASLKSSLGALIRPNASADVSDVELRGRLFEALYSVEPAFNYLDAVFPEKNEVVYCVSPDGDWVLYRRGYTVAEDGAVTLSGDRVEVRLKQNYEEVTAAEAQPVVIPETPKAATGGCGCGGHKSTPTQENENMERKARVAAFIANPNQKLYTADDAAVLEQLSDARLTALEASLVPATPATPATPAVQETPRTAEVKTKTEAEWMAEAPASIRSLVDQAKATNEAKKSALIVQLKDNGAFTEDELKGMEVPQLEKLVTLAGKQTPAADFSGQGVNRSAARTEESVDAPPSLNDSIRANRGQSKQ
jgi:hypothetical protein